jgi:hypothetical protein
MSMALVLSMAVATLPTDLARAGCAPGSRVWTAGELMLHPGDTVKEGNATLSFSKDAVLQVSATFFDRFREKNAISNDSRSHR